MLNKFYAVTKTSVYEVEALEDRVSAKKIALHDESKLAVGDELVTPGCMLAICGHLQAYIPEKYGFMHPSPGEVERRLENVSTAYWRGRTSAIVALFKEKEAALECFGTPDLERADPRWLDSTLAVIAEIGDEHPFIYVCRLPSLALQPLDKAS